ncbi:hypothetical protein [Agromyces sp. Soil535]|uniref:hypothetical protein n=1 Tax=Agromyces sp. Soil535 TaxID=1736390 RepID=UPI0006F31898|nr:hypothetical protein [Agromyces sp. Soil535]KRE31072.1 hypothetical protein ASG80_00850 [Agromyces sp. Soil535]
MDILTAFGSAVIIAGLLGLLLLGALLSYRLLSMLISVQGDVRRAERRARREKVFVADLERQGFSSSDAEDAVRSTRD